MSRWQIIGIIGMMLCLSCLTGCHIAHSLIDNTLYSDPEYSEHLEAKIYIFTDTQAAEFLQRQDQDLASQPTIKELSNASRDGASLYLVALLKNTGPSYAEVVFACTINNWRPSRKTMRACLSSNMNEFQVFIVPVVPQSIVVHDHKQQKLFFKNDWYKVFVR